MQTFLNLFFEKNAVWVHNFLTYVYFVFKMEKLTVSLSFYVYYNLVVQYTYA